MVLFLLYRCAGPRHADPIRVGNRLRLMFEPLFDELPPAAIVSEGGSTVISFSMPVRRWRAPLIEEDDRTWALSPNYPLDAEDCLRSRGLLATDEPVLPALARALQREPQPVLRELAPPLSLLWRDKS